MLKVIGIIGGILIAVAASATMARPDTSIKADKVLVVKSERKLYLLKNGAPIKVYNVSLGLNPQGHKQEKGDKKTPEGLYILDRRNPKSKYYKSIHISYPNEQDRKRAAERGVDPGGDIVLHGLPVNSKDEAWDYIERDWTDGCIAVTNDEMQEIWELVPDFTPIEITP